MKKILLATSVLAATTGFAAAEVTVTGSARMGVVYNSLGFVDADGNPTGEDFAFSSRVRVVFNMVGTTDGGLEFGASVRADQQGGNDNDAGALKNGFSNGDSTVYVAINGLKVTFGDVGGAADALVGQTSGVGFGPNDGLHEIGFIGTSKTAAYAEYSTGALTFGLSSGQIASSDAELSVAVKYSTDAFSVALGYEDADAGSALHVAGSATFGAVTVKARVTDNGDLVIAAGETPFSLSVDYAAGATTVTGFYTDFDNNTTHIGVGVAYDLGGGASIKGALVQQDTGAAKNEFADVGIVMSF
jgi:outer membrane protein OmpU